MNGPAFIVALILSFPICAKLNRNTFGTTSAYAKRWFLVLAFTYIILSVIFSSYGIGV